VNVRRANAKKNRKQRLPSLKRPRAKTTAFSEALLIDLALAAFNVFIKHGLLDVPSKLANGEYFKIQPFAGGKPS
jgi:hypothetical protein